MSWEHDVEEHLKWEEQALVPYLPTEDVIWLIDQHTRIRNFNYDKAVVLAHAAEEEQRFESILPLSLALHLVYDHLELKGEV